MKILGEPILEHNFKWTPSSLLEMIEIDKICPEEGHPNQPNANMDPAPQTQ
jgi:hypothetical protein